MKSKSKHLKPACEAFLERVAYAVPSYSVDAGVPIYTLRYRANSVISIDSDNKLFVHNIFTWSCLTPAVWNTVMRELKLPLTYIPGQRQDHIETPWGQRVATGKQSVIELLDPHNYG